MNDRRDRYGDRDREPDRKRIREDHDRDRDRDRERAVTVAYAPVPVHPTAPDPATLNPAPVPPFGTLTFPYLPVIGSHRNHRCRSRSPTSPSRKRHKYDAISKDKDRHKDDSVSKVKKQKENAVSKDESSKGVDMMDEDDMEMMKKFGIPTGFDSTKGTPVPGNDIGAVRKVTKRQPQQYMNRRGGFNRPLPSEINR
ncbi:hypothetical protein OROMI_002968 [Orobanche minor]